MAGVDLLLLLLHIVISPLLQWSFSCSLWLPHTHIHTAAGVYNTHPMLVRRLFACVTGYSCCNYLPVAEQVANQYFLAAGQSQCSMDADLFLLACLLVVVVVCFSVYTLRTLQSASDRVAKSVQAASFLFLFLFFSLKWRRQRNRLLFVSQRRPSLYNDSRPVGRGQQFSPGGDCIIYQAATAATTTTTTTSTNETKKTNGHFESSPNRFTAHKTQRTHTQTVGWRSDDLLRALPPSKSIRLFSFLFFFFFVPWDSCCWLANVGHYKLALIFSIDSATRREGGKLLQQPCKFGCKQVEIYRLRLHNWKRGGKQRQYREVPFFVPTTGNSPVANQVNMKLILWGRHS